MSKVLRIYWQDYPGKLPTDIVKELGYTVTAREVIGIADCDMIEIKEDVVQSQLPEKIKIVDYKFSFDK